MDPAETSRGLVILADDEPVIGDLGRIVLTHQGFDVQIARHGREALAIYEAQRKQVRAVLLDVTMPVLDGFQTLSQLRAMDAALPVILWSGYTDIELPEGVDRARTRFLRKPFTIVDLRTAMEELMAT